jgi:hypothetical protein
VGRGGNANLYLIQFDKANLETGWGSISKSVYKSAVFQVSMAELA